MSELPFGQKGDDNRPVGSKQRGKMRKVVFSLEDRRAGSDLVI